MFATIFANAQDVYITKNATMHFFSGTIVEDIEAETNEGMSAVDIKKGTVYFKVPINTFEFERALMQEHFNENYLESDKFPYSEYNGNIFGDVEWDNAGTYEVEVEGELEIHGKTVKRTDAGTITVNEDGTITIESKFIVALEDHDIAIPKLLIKNIAEKVEVSVSGTYNLNK